MTMTAVSTSSTLPTVRSRSSLRPTVRCSPPGGPIRWNASLSASVWLTGPRISARARRMPQLPSARITPVISRRSMRCRSGSSARRGRWPDGLRFAGSHPERRCRMRRSPRPSAIPRRCGPRHPSVLVMPPRCSYRATACCARTGASAASHGVWRSSGPCWIGRIRPCFQPTLRLSLEGCRVARRPYAKEDAMYQIAVVASTVVLAAAAPLRHRGPATTH